MANDKGIKLTDMETLLRRDVGVKGIQFFAPQLDIIRRARNLPKNLEDGNYSMNGIIRKTKPFATVKFYESLGLIEQWLNPLNDVFKIVGLDEKKKTLRKLQIAAAFNIRQKRITSWQQVQEDEETRLLFNEIKILRYEIEGQLENLLNKCNRADITTLLALVLYPHLYRKALIDAVDDAKTFYGPNVEFKRKDKYTDALIFALASEETFRFASLEKVLATPDSQEMWEIKNAYDKAKAQQYKGKAGFTTKQLDYLAEKFLGRRFTLIEKDEFASAYMYESDRFRPDIILDWLSKKVKAEKKPSYGTEKQKTGIVSSRFKDSTKKRHLFGLSFMDKHKRHETLGNVPQSSFELFEVVLAPFHELKQHAVIMQTSQFTVECLGLPEQAWIYDFTGIKTEILRLTMLLISERQPKFDLLEACQRLSSAILSGRVDRDDVRMGNYIATEKLPRNTWNHAGRMLVEILEETLVHEESTAQKIVRNIFAETDRSGLVTSKQFTPAFQLDISYKPRTLSPNEITIYAAKDFDLQYRHVLISGYPWYGDVCRNLEKLVEDSFNVSSSQRSALAGNVHLRQVVFDISGNSFINFYSPSESGLSVLSFLETRTVSKDGQEAINPVEVIFRPRKFLERGPKRNHLDLLLDKARATDPKDLQVVISNL